MQTLCLESGPRTAPNWPEIQTMTMMSQFSDMTSTSNFFDVALLLLSSLVTDRGFMSVSSLALEFWQFSFLKDWPEIRKLEIPPSEFCPISGYWHELWVPNLARMSLINCYWMLQNSRVTAFTVDELLRENQLGGGVKLPSTHIRVKGYPWYKILNSLKQKLWSAPCKTQVKNFFVWYESYVPFSRYSSFCSSWWVLAHKAGCIFEYIFWTTTN